MIGCVGVWEGSGCIIGWSLKMICEFFCLGVSYRWESVGDCNFVGGGEGSILVVIWWFGGFY